MDTPYKIIPVTGNSEERTADLAAKPDYRALQAITAPALNGGSLERVLVFHEGEYTDMFVDDRGLSKGLPRNEAATAIYRNNMLTHRRVKDPETLPAIYGPAVLFSRRVWF